MIIYLVQETQIVLLNIKKIHKNILAKYLDFTDIFSKKLVVKLPKR